MPKTIFKYTYILIFLFPFLIQAIQPQNVLNEQANTTVTKSGVSVRKGTIYATILNIETFNQLIQQLDSVEKKENIEKIVQDIKAVIPALEAVQLFNLFHIEEWISPNSQNEGRLLVGLLYLQAFPEFSNEEIIESLKQKNRKFSKELQREMINTLAIINQANQ